MKAVVYQGPNQKEWTDVPDPTITDSRDAIIQVDTTTICGTDLHILAGHVPTVTPGRILGHEAVGTVVEVGPGVTNLSRGDRVLVSCISACGTCRYCRVRSYGQCLGGGGWILGHTIDGVQAEYARHSVRRPVHLPAARGRHRRGGGPALRHPADVVRGRGAQRQGQPGRHRRGRRSRSDRPRCADHRAPVLPRRHHRHRQGREPTAGGQAVRRRHRRPTRRTIRSRSSTRSPTGSAPTW